MRAGAEERPEIARQAPAVAAARGGQFIERHWAFERGVQVVSRQLRGAEVGRGAQWPRARHGVERMREIEERVVLFERVHGAVDALQQRLRRGSETRIVRQTAFDERQRLAAERRLEQCGLDIDHPVAEAFGGAGLTVVRLVGVQHHGAAGQTVAHAAPVMKALHARQRATDRVSIVPVQCVAVVLEECLDALDAIPRGRAPDPVVVAPRTVRRRSVCRYGGRAKVLHGFAVRCQGPARNCCRSVSSPIRYPRNPARAGRRASTAPRCWRRHRARHRRARPC
ncbi:conserved hypothetical protein [Ricinus communis]|uniref:Uncharacterized protein n=1 Tax=Ricinus communis TaxID=3988 RepID=B9TI23_RICCO|nr:conserved hypothetical protein [Ricinus communis]